MALKQVPGRAGMEVDLAANDVEETATPDPMSLLGTFDSPTVANAIETFRQRDRAVGFVGGRVRCLFPALPPMIGRALTVTVRNRPGPPGSRDGFWAMWEALERLGGPSVVVAQDVSGEPSRCAYFGEVMARIAARLGAVGMVTDGGVRDLTEVSAIPFAYFARYVVVSHGNYEIVDVGAPVTLDGQEIATGDILHGDQNGIVLVPDELVSRLPDAIAGIRRSEETKVMALDEPDFTVARYRAGGTW
jgi:4-hydroxy-4-methyl-2-oxoglutarate aldolase